MQAQIRLNSFGCKVIDYTWNIRQHEWKPVGLREVSNQNVNISF